MSNTGKFLPWLLLPLVAGCYLQLASPLPLAEQWHSLLSPSWENYAQIEYRYALWPRLLLAILLGAAMAVSGSLLQQLTQNPLVSPMTLGVSSGAWLAVVLANIFLPGLLASQGEWFALAGATLALLLVWLLSGGDWQGRSLILAGMAVNLLLGAVASAAIMMNEQYSRGLFVWGAGDLTQTGEYWLLWCLPRLLPIFLMLFLLHRPLQLLRLGQNAADAAGLNLRLFGTLLVLTSLWLSAVSITAVGLISFISLLAPNIARLTGARGASALALSACYGALFLLVGDALALFASQYFADKVPSNVTVALIGAPALIYFCLKQRFQPSLDSLENRFAFNLTLNRQRQLLLIALGLIILFTACLLERTHDGWALAWPDPQNWALRWPRLLAAGSAGVGLAVTGCILQRLLQNPLASPELLGISAGASLGLLAVFFYWPNTSIVSAAWLGAGGVLLLLLRLGKNQPPAKLVLVGLGLSSLFEALLQLALAKGTVDSFRLLNWLVGSTYTVSPTQAILMALAVLILSSLAIALSRILSLLTLGEQAAEARGLAIKPAYFALLLLAGSLCALITSQLGPLTFVGLLLPHLARLCGAGGSRIQLLVAAGLGAVLLASADTLSRTLIFPYQLPTGLIASLLCGSLLLIFLLGYRTMKRGR